MTSTEQPKGAPSLLRQISHYLGGQVAVMAAGFISMPILTRMLGKERLGTVSLVTSMLIVLSAVGKMGLSESAVRFAGRPDVGGERRERALQSTLLVTAFTASFALALLLAGACWWFLHGGANAGAAGRILTFVLGGSDAAPYMALAGVLLIARTGHALLWALQRAEHKSTAWTAYSIIVRYGSLVCSIGAFLVFRTISAYLWGIIVAEGAVALVYLVGWWRSHKLSPLLFSAPLATMSLAYGVPLIGSELANVLVAYCDKFIIKFFFNDAAVGLYAGGYGVAEVLPIMLAFPIELAVKPHCFRMWETEGEARTVEFAASAAARYAVVIFPVMAMFSVAARTIVMIMAGPEYEASIPVIPWALAGIGLWCGFHPLITLGYLVRKQTGALTGVLAAAVVLNAGLNWVMVPRMGFMGSAVATFITYVAVLAMAVVGARRRLKVPWQWASMARSALFSAGVGFGVMAIPLGNGALATLVRIAIGSLVYIRVMVFLDANARWVAAAAGKWLAEHGLPAGAWRAVTGAR